MSVLTGTVLDTGNSRAPGLHADIRIVPGACPGPHPIDRDRSLDWAAVLVVDDNEANVALLERLLRRMGVGQVIGLTDPRRVVEHYQRFGADVVLVDLHMPHLDGLEVMQALGQVIPPDSFTPVVVLTADATGTARQAALEAGAQDFLTKPFEHTEVVLRVRNLLQTRALHEALRRHTAELEVELAERAEKERRAAEQTAERRQRVQAVLDAGTLHMVFQPIFNLGTGAVGGVEALARFPGSPPRPPNEWFDEATRAGLGPDLELAAVQAAVAQTDRLPPGVYLSLNVSPDTVLDDRIHAILGPDAERIVLELTEHAAVERYGTLLDALRPLRDRGIRVAIDDAGAGYASLRHILQVQPEIIKLDIGLTSGIHLDPARRALAASLVAFAEQTGAAIVAEGIELQEELDTLRSLGVGYGQGFHLARPGPLPVGELAVVTAG